MSRRVSSNTEVCTYTIGEMDSGLIVSAGYHVPNRALWIKLCTGISYRYRDVPERVVDRLRHAESMGEFYNQHIRDEFEFDAHEFA